MFKAANWQPCGVQNWWFEEGEIDNSVAGIVAVATKG
jgi:hypothetical protein